MSPLDEWYCAVDRMIAKLRGDPDSDRPKVLDHPDCKKAHSIFEVGGDPKEISRLLVKAIQGTKKNG